MPSLSEIKERIPFLSGWETQRFGKLRVDYHDGLKRAPYQISIDLQRLHLLLEEFSFFGTKSDESDTHIIVDSTEKINRLVGQRRFGQLENKTPSYPCIIRLYGGSFYGYYLEELQKNVSPENTRRATQENIALTIAHEESHFQFLGARFLPQLLYASQAAELDEIRKKIWLATGAIPDEEEILCECLSASMVANDPRWFDCVEFSPKSPSRVSGVPS